MKNFYAYNRLNRTVMSFIGKDARDEYVNKNTDVAYNISYSEAEKLMSNESNKVNVRNLLKNRVPRLISKVTTKTSNGMLSKGWYDLGDGAEYLVKACSMGNYEPFGEFLGGNISHIMTEGYALKVKLDVASKYPELTNYDFPYVSLVKKWESKRTEQYAKLVDRLSVNLPEHSGYWEWLAENATPLLWKQICIMLITDAVVGNQDRHWNNFDIDYSTRDIPALIDYGVSCLAVNVYSLDQIKGSKEILLDSTKSFEESNMENMELVKGLLEMVAFTPKMVCPVYAIQKVLKLKEVSIEIRNYNKEYLDVAIEHILLRAKTVKKKLRGYVFWDKEGVNGTDE